MWYFLKIFVIIHSIEMLLAYHSSKNGLEVTSYFKYASFVFSKDSKQPINVN